MEFRLNTSFGNRCLRGRMFFEEEVSQAKKQFITLFFLSQALLIQIGRFLLLF